MVYPRVSYSTATLSPFLTPFAGFRSVVCAVAIIAKLATSVIIVRFIFFNFCYNYCYCSYAAKVEVSRVLAGTCLKGGSTSITEVFLKLQIDNQDIKIHVIGTKRLYVPIHKHFKPYTDISHWQIDSQ